jgi:hypothetical protein
MIGMLLCMACMAQSSPVQERTSASLVRVDAAIRVSAVIDLTGQEQPCVLAENAEKSCVVLKVSGIDAAGLPMVWMQKTGGGVRIVSEGTEHRVGSVVTDSSSSTSAVLYVNLPKSLTEGELLVQDRPPARFTLGPTVQRVRLEDLFRESEKK